MTHLFAADSSLGRRYGIIWNVDFLVLNESLSVEVSDPKRLRRRWHLRMIILQEDIDKKDVSSFPVELVQPVSAPPLELVPDAEEGSDLDELFEKRLGIHVNPHTNDPYSIDSHEEIKVGAEVAYHWTLRAARRCSRVYTSRSNYRFFCRTLLE